MEKTDSRIFNLEDLTDGFYTINITSHIKIDDKVSNLKWERDILSSTLVKVDYLVYAVGNLRLHDEYDSTSNPWVIWDEHPDADYQHHKVVIRNSDSTVIVEHTETSHFTYFSDTELIGYINMDKLPSGDYTVEVTAMDAYGNEQDPPATLSFTNP